MGTMVDKSSLKYLGEEYQYKLVKEFMEDKSCFRDLAPIIDQNMFTGQYLKTYVGTMLEYLKKHNCVPSYSSMAIALKQKAHTQADIEICDAIVNKVRNTSSDGSEQTKELATKFFKQQNIIKAANEMLRLAGNGDLENYDRCEELLRNALTSGSHEDYEESCLFDNIDEVLSKDSRIVIPTGIGKVDEVLNGGIGKGELGTIVGPSGFGKALDVNEPVVTPTGYVRIGDIKVGDKVFGRDGKLHNVLGVYPQGIMDIYKVKFNDGSESYCTLDHLWNVSDIDMRSKNGVSYKTMALKDILNEGLLHNGSYRFMIPMAKPIEFEHKFTEEKPYDYGRLLYRNSNRIPSEYLINDIKSRIELLNGIMDTYGMINSNGSCSLGLIFEEQRDDIKFLVESLGGSVIDIPITHSSHELIFYFYDESIKPFTDNSKQKYVKYLDECISRRFTSVEKVYEHEAVCIKVDADDSLYLTRDFIVTHNTSLTTAIALHAATAKTEQNNGEGFKVIQFVFEDPMNSVKRKHFSKITQVEACHLSKDEYEQHVREILDNYPDRELATKNLRIIRLHSGEKSIDFIQTLIKHHINIGFRPDLVIIDYFECIKLTGPSQSTKWEKESGIMRKIESMTNELNIAVWVPVQGNRDSINAELVTMDNAGGSLGKIQISHIIMSITRSLDDISNNVATISILKNRAGSSGKVIEGVLFNNGTCTISTDNVQEYGNSVEFGKHREEVKEREQDDLKKQIFLEMRKKKQDANSEVAF
jgi:replicative DNA helicase